MKHFRFGKWVESAESPSETNHWSRAKIAALCMEAEQRRTITAAYPLAGTWKLLEKLRRLWSDPQYDRRKKCQAHLPIEIGFSPEMIALGLERLPMILDPRVLEKKVITELRNIPRTGGVHFDPNTQTAMRWEPLGVLLHVLAGNGFLGGISSFLEGMLTGNVSLLKTSSDKTFFLHQFLESLTECDEDGIVSGSIATLSYPSSNAEAIAELKQRVDGIVVWGGEAAVKAYREDVPARTRVVVFGPKLSLGIITREGAREKSVKQIADSMAAELAIWDQSACTAPQLCYVESEALALEFGKALATSLDEIAKKLPPGEVDRDAAVEIQKMRGLALLDESKKEGALYESEHGLDWTIVVTKRLAPETSPLHRTLRVIAYPDFKDVLRELAPLRGYLQTVGIATGDLETPRICEDLTRVGCLRLLDLGKMSFGLVDDPHDGAFDLPQLMYLVFNRVALPSDGIAWIDTITRSDREKIIDERLSELESSTWRYSNLEKLIAGKPLKNRTDLAKLPILHRDEADTQTRVPFSGGYIARSGGSTGEPRFSIYDGHDWEEMISRSVDLFRAVGVKPGDRVANCLTAGDLYGSFVSFDHINARSGVTNFAFALTHQEDAFLRAWREFKINVIQAMPTYLIPFLRSIKTKDPHFQFETLIYGGMPLPAHDEAWLRQDCGVRRISAIFGANDGGPLGYQCSSLRGRHYHSLDDTNYLEIVDDHGKDVTQGKAGRILLTSLRKFTYPLIRYEIGDLGRWLTGECECGRTGRRFEYLGRIEEQIHWQQASFSMIEISEICDGLGISQAQIEIQTAELTLNVECATQTPHADLQNLITKFLSKHGVSNPQLKIKTFAVGGIPRKPGSVKVSSVIDHRTGSKSRKNS